MWITNARLFMIQGVFIHFFKGLDNMIGKIKHLPLRSLRGEWMNGYWFLETHSVVKPVFSRNPKKHIQYIFWLYIVLVVIHEIVHCDLVMIIHLFLSPRMFACLELIQYQKAFIAEVVGKSDKVDPSDFDLELILFFIDKIFLDFRNIALSFFDQFAERFAENLLFGRLHKGAILIEKIRHYAESYCAFFFISSDTLAMQAIFVPPFLFVISEGTYGRP